jgi:hypothetical protein
MAATHIPAAFLRKNAIFLNLIRYVMGWAPLFLPLDLRFNYLIIWQLWHQADDHLDQRYQLAIGYFVGVQFRQP